MEVQPRVEVGAAAAVVAVNRNPAQVADGPEQARGKNPSSVLQKPRNLSGRGFGLGNLGILTLRWILVAAGVRIHRGG